MQTVTIGIPAHNESRNIIRLLDSILKQETTNYQIEKIIVACDGCTDNTADIVRQYTLEHPVVSLIDDGKRMGQGGRLDNFYRIAESDIFITFDADTVLRNTQVIDRLVAAFDQPNIGLVGGRGIPLPPRNFWESVFIAWIDVWYEARKDFQGGDTVHNHEGCISAMARPLYRKMVIPRDVIASDEFLYFQAKALGFNFAFAAEASTLYRCPATVADYERQSFRFLETKYLLTQYFSFDILSQYPLPFSRKARALGRVFLKHPARVMLALLLQIKLRCVKFDKGLSKTSGVWETVKSTK